MSLVMSPVYQTERDCHRQAAIPLDAIYRAPSNHPETCLVPKQHRPPQTALCHSR